MDDDRNLKVIPEERPGPETRGPAKPDKSTTKLKLALAAALAVAAALAGALYITQHRSDAEREATEAITAYTDAWNAHDLEAVKKAMAGNGTFAASDALERAPIFTAYRGPELDKVLNKLFEANIRLKTQGTVTIAGDDPTRASISQQFSYKAYGLPVEENGISHYTLGPISEQNPKLVVVQHTFWRPRTPANPSMLWILES